MKINKKIMYITQAAVLTAILVGWQAATAPIGQTLLTGSGVNLLLVVAVTACSLPVGLAVALISPFMASLVGFGPAFPVITPFIALGNISLVLVWFLLRKIRPAAIIAAAAVKCAVLYLAVVKIAVPLFIPQKAAPAITAAFSIPQFFTAVIGGCVGYAVYIALKKAGVYGTNSNS